MDTLEFLQWVLPAEGYYAAIAIDEGAPQQALYATVVPSCAISVVIVIQSFL